MARRSRTYRLTSWPAFSAHLVLIVAIAFLTASLSPALGFANGLIFAFALYFAYLSVSRALLLVHHNRAMKLFRQGNFPAAIAAFAASERDLAARPWIDNWRWLVVLNASALSYREVALFNIGKAQDKLGLTNQARQTFTHLLEISPRSPVAPTIRVIIQLLDPKNKKK